MAAVGAAVLGRYTVTAIGGDAVELTETCAPAVSAGSCSRFTRAQLSPGSAVARFSRHQ